MPPWSQATKRSPPEPDPNGPHAAPTQALFGCEAGTSTACLRTATRHDRTKFLEWTPTARPRAPGSRGQPDPESQPLKAAAHDHP